MKKVEAFIIFCSITLIVMFTIAIIWLNNSIKELQNTATVHKDVITEKEKYLNSNNNVINQLVSDKDMCNLYYENYRKMLINSPKEAYELLDLDYKAKRFPKYEQFEKYVNENKEYLKMNGMREFSRTNYDDYYLYTIKDQCGNMYLFKETAVLEYTVQLDDYTLENPIYNQAYKKASIMDRCLLNCEKYIQILNMQDYTTAYELLNDNFKNSNFKTQADFEKYLKDKFPKYCKAMYSEYRKPLDGVNIIKTKVVDATYQSLKSAEFNIVMVLRDGIDFEISFEMPN